MEHKKFSLELHGLRGLAAMMVLIAHTNIIDTRGLSIDFLRHLLNSPGAVTIFFVLSGLVLGLSLEKTPLRFFPYLAWETKRCFRLIPLLVCTVIAGTIFINVFKPITDYSFIFYFRKADFSQHVDLPHFILGLIGAAPRANPPIWSIFIEIVASLSLPFIVAASRHRVGKWTVLLIVVLLACANLGQVHNWNYYMLDFYAGLSILWWGQGFATRFLALPRMVRWAIILTLFAGFMAFRQSIGHEYYGGRFVNLGEVIMVVPLVALIYWAPHLFTFLKSRSLVFLGEISYSLYLTHFIIVTLFTNLMMSAFPTLETHLALFQILLTFATVATTLIVATISMRWIEKPGIRMGYHVGRIIKNLESKFVTPPQTNFPNET